MGPDCGGEHLSVSVLGALLITRTGVVVGHRDAPWWQAADRLAWGPDWPDTDLLFTRKDGTPVPGQWVSVRFEALAFRAGLAPVRFHDLRHGAASQCKAAGVDTKVISALLGHSRTDFTNRTYVLVFPEVARAAAEAAAAIVPRSDTGNGGR